MAFTPEQIETLELLFKLTPAQRQRALQLAVQAPKPASPAISRVKNYDASRSPSHSPSQDSSCTESTSGGSESASGGSESSGSNKRLHSKNRVNRLTHKICKQYLNSQRMWDHVYGENGRLLEHRLDAVLHQINRKLSYKEQKTFKTYNLELMKDLKKKWPPIEGTACEKKRRGSLCRTPTRRWL